MKVLLISIAIFAIISVIAWKSSRFAYETANYTVLEKNGRFEIRNYPKLILASTSMDSPDPNDGGTFMRLFRYIAKGNDAEEKIAMTTPVFMTRGEGAEMSFVLPEAVAQNGAPTPSSKQVEVEDWKPGKMAVYRYSGSWRNAHRLEAEKTLSKWLEENRIKPKGDFVAAGYDPPFTPPFLRRNEILVPIE